MLKILTFSRHYSGNLAHFIPLYHWYLMSDSHVSSMNWRSVWRKIQKVSFLFDFSWQYFKIGNILKLILLVSLFNKDFIVSKWPLKHPIHVNSTLFLGVIQFPFKCFHFQLLLMSNILIRFRMNRLKSTFKISTHFCQGDSSYLRKHFF